MHTTTLFIDNLSKKYSNKQVLENITTLFNGGDIIGLLGKNGVGKTTLINCIVGLVDTDLGHITFNGSPLSDDKIELKSVLGIMSDQLPPIAEFTGMEYLEFISLVHNIDNEEFIQRSADVLRFFFGDNAPFLNQPIKGYSTGMRKIIDFCATILSLPTVLFLDEPFTGLDVVMAKKMLSFLQDYSNNQRIIVIISHDLDYLEKVINRVLVIEDCSIVFDDSLEAFTHNRLRSVEDSFFALLNPASTKTTFSWI